MLKHFVVLELAFCCSNHADISADHAFYYYASTPQLVFSSVLLVLYWNAQFNAGFLHDEEDLLSGKAI